MAGTLQADELRHVFQILSEYEVITSRDNGNVAHAQSKQPLATTRVVEDVNVLVIDAFSRKKLFRPKTTASPRLGEQNEFFGDRIHGEVQSGGQAKNEPTPRLVRASR